MLTALSQGLFGSQALAKHPFSLFGHCRVTHESQLRARKKLVKIQTWVGFVGGDFSSRALSELSSLFRASQLLASYTRPYSNISPLIFESRLGELTTGFRTPGSPSKRAQQVVDADLGVELSICVAGHAFCHFAHDTG